MHNMIKCVSGDPTPGGYISNTAPALMAQVIWQRGSKKIVRAIRPETLLGDFLSPGNKEATSMIPQQYRCLNKTWLMVISIDMLIQKGEVLLGTTLTPRKRTTGN